MNRSTLGREQVAEMLGAPPQIRQDLARRMATLIRSMARDSEFEGLAKGNPDYAEARAIFAELPKL